MQLLKIYPSPEERQYLNQIGLIDLRTPDAVVRWLIREEAQRRGLTVASIPNANQIETPAPELEASHAG